eukprot:TRINITY_DN63080_c0_g1_i1.p1 TRINITY_DN63080_c0_g1~~TRINITY_DN63080_c0_g1_i1.p1  ORF type:complete len:337 (+),score=54.12 TRINITY_DN63080_c0_g1_i1:135-1145(+)
MAGGTGPVDVTLGPSAAAGMAEPLADGTKKKANMHDQLIVWELIFVPWLVLVILLTLMLYAGKNSLITLVAVPLLVGGVSAAFVRRQWRERHTPEVMLGMLVLVATLAATIIGTYANTTSLLEYYRITKGASYFNILPEDRAAGRSDATTLVFGSGVTIDDSQTYGFVDGHSSSRDTYCVAPVSMGNAGDIRVQYWAAGKNCCEPRGDFHCGGDADDERTVTGAIVMPAAVRSNPLFDAAVKGAQATYGLQAGDDYLLVKWTNDPIKYTTGLFSRTRNLFLVFGLVYLVISFMLGFILIQVVKPSGSPPREEPPLPGRLAPPPPPAATAPFPPGWM